MVTVMISVASSYVLYPQNTCFCPVGVFQLGTGFAPRSQSSMKVHFER